MGPQRAPTPSKSWFIGAKRSAHRSDNQLHQLSRGAQVSAEEGYHLNRELVIPRLRQKAAAGDAQAKQRLSQILQLESQYDSSGLEEILGHETRDQRRARRQQHVQNLKTRAAAGDQQAIARLQKMQADLALPGVSPQSTTPYYPSAAPPALPQTYPTGTYSYPAQSAYAYQSPYYDPSLSQNPYGPPPQPTIDVYQGDDESGLCVRTDSLGRQEIVDGWSPWGAIKSVATAPLKAVKYSFTVPYKAARAYSNPNKQVKSWSDLTRFSGSDALKEIWDPTLSATTSARWPARAATVTARRWPGG